jgi:phosphoserine phosphatase
VYVDPIYTHAQAMGGDVKFQDAIRARLDILKPSAADLAALTDGHDFPLTEGIIELIGELRAAGKEVFFVSGGLLPLVAPGM